MDGLNGYKTPEILIVDDSPEQIYLVHSLLREENYQVRALTEGSKVFDSLGKSLPDLILLDIVMPQISGFTICKQLKNDERYSSIPVIFLTSKNDSDSIVEGFLAGAQDYVSKPVNPKELLARVGTHIHLKQKTDKLSEAYKDIKAFSHMVSHDLKAPLWSIQTIAKHLAQADKEEMDEIVAIMCEKAKEAVMLIDKLSEISMLVNAEFVGETINMHQLSKEVYDSLLMHIENRKVEFFIGNLPVVYGDATLLRQVLINIFSNALKFTRGRDKPAIAINCQKNGREYIFSVKDNGAGFNIKYADKLFDIFQRLHSDQEFEGTGTGLVIVKKIVNRHGGRVWISGEVDKGAEICFTLPIREG